jgi:hypothetical protein
MWEGMTDKADIPVPTFWPASFVPVPLEFVPSVSFPMIARESKNEVTTLSLHDSHASEAPINFSTKTLHHFFGHHVKS